VSDTQEQPKLAKRSREPLRDDGRCCRPPRGPSGIGTSTRPRARAAGVFAQFLDSQMYLEAKRGGRSQGMNVKTQQKRALEQSSRVQKSAPVTCVVQHAERPPPAPPPILRRHSSTGLSDALGTGLSLGEQSDEDMDIEPVSSRKRAKPPLPQDLTLRQKQGKKNGRKGSVRDRPRPHDGGTIAESITVGGHTLRWRRTDRSNATGRGLLSQAVADRRNMQQSVPRRSAEARASALEQEQITQHCDVLFGAGRAAELPEEVVDVIKQKLRKPEGPSIRSTSTTAWHDG
jgi:hypothetical protein